MGLPAVFEWKTYILTALAVVSFSNFVAVLFGQTIPGVIADFFRVAGEYVVLGSVFVFALAWLLRARPHGRPRGYDVVVFDVYGRQSAIDGIRTRFQTHDVAWSYMKQYKRDYPLYNFAMVSKMPSSDRPTIFRYI